MNSTAEYWERRRVWKTEPAPGFYVSVIDGERRALVAGPFETHEQALALVEDCRNHFSETDGRLWFAAWGTAHVNP